jgi:hypothetical protein
MSQFTVPPVNYHVYGCFENLYLSCDSFDLDADFTLRKIGWADIKHLYATQLRDPHDEGLPLEGIDCLSSVLETFVELHGNDVFPPIWAKKDIRVATARLRTISEALLLYFDGMFKLRLFEPNPTERIEHKEREGFRRTIPLWRNGLFMSKYADEVRLDEKELHGFREFLQAYESLEKPDFAKRSIHRFISGSEMAGEFQDLEYRFVDYIRSLEALIGEPGEAGQKLAFRTSALLGGTSDERQDTYDFMKGAYSWRSGSAHGEAPRPWTKRLSWMRETEAVDILHWYCRRAIRRIVDLLLAIDKDATTANRWKDKNKSEKRSWIANMLDCSLVRGDLAETITSFYEGTVDANSLYSQYDKTLKAPFESRNNVISIMAPPDPNERKVESAVSDRIDEH